MSRGALYGLTLAGAFLLSGMARATEYVVDGVAGSDANPGSAAAAFKTVSRGLAAAQPGDTVTVRAGTYAGPIATVRDGSTSAPIVVRSERSRAAVLTASGNVISVGHAYNVFEGFVADGQFGPDRAVKIASSGTALVLRDMEIENAGRNCVDMDSPDGVVIEQSSIHHCLFDDPATAGPDDAHGITGTGPTNLTVRNTEIHYFSGDAIQLSPPRAFWDNLVVEHAILWTGALPEATPIYPAGAVVGENALDTKTPSSGPRPHATLRDVVAYGFRGFITNQAAFNLKENVDVTIDGVTVYASEIAFRLRGPALVTLRNAVAYGNDRSVRYEDGIAGLSIHNVTLADPVFFLDGGGGGLGAGFSLHNALFAGGALPPEAAGVSSNLSTGPEAFVDASANDYHLLQKAAAVDVGETLVDVMTDRDLVPRPHGAAYDVGAYEWTDQPPPATDGGITTSGAGASASGGVTTGAGGANDAAASEESGGCGCRTAASGAPWQPLAGILFLCARLRRRSCRPARQSRYGRGRGSSISRSLRWRDLGDGGRDSAHLRAATRRPRARRAFTSTSRSSAGGCRIRCGCSRRRAAR